LLFSTTVSLTACSGTGTSGPATGGSGPITLEFWTINLKEGYQTYIESNIKKYEDTHSGVKVKWVDVTDMNQTSSKLLTAISGGATPDVVNVTPFILPKFATSGALYSIDEIDSNVKAIQDQYTPGFWDAGVIGAKSYAIPYYGSTGALLYNASLFSKAGLDPAKPPTTWPEVFAAAKKIHAVTGAAGFAQTLDDFDDAGNTADILASEAGVPLISADGKKASFATPSAVSFFDNYVQGIKEGWIGRTSINGDTMAAAKDLAEGKAAMVFNGPWLMRWLKANSSPTLYSQIKVAAHPKSPTGFANAFLQNFAIPKASRYPKQALDFARYFSGTVVQLAQQAPVLPTLKANLSDPTFTSLPDAPVLTDQPVKFFWPKSGSVAELLAALRNEMQAAMLGQKSTDQALRDAAKQWDGLLASS
jgi:putative chitobiose transport system substrate-binding protein